MTSLIAHGFLANGDFLRGSRQAVSMHVLGLTLRQRLYGEVLNGGQILDDIMHYRWDNVPMDIWYLSIVPAVVLFAVRDRDMLGKRSMEKLMAVYRSPTGSRDMDIFVQIVVLTFLIVFTKDVRSVT